MENISFAKNKTGWLGGIEAVQTEEISKKEFVSYEQIKEHLSALYKDVEKAYNNNRNKHVYDALISIEQSLLSIEEI